MGRWRSMIGALQVIFQMTQTTTWKIKDVSTLAYSNLDNSKEMEQMFICNEIR